MPQELQDDWDHCTLSTRLSILAGETTVLASLLAEDDNLMRMIRQGRPESECLAHINENY